ncbi:DUF4232 domain-containing protein [Streptomyces sp. NPDC058773]|uniref:DUF4232 domain-containing protein n=1 Tax=Streptomyces sp. NPDC058773 TaxID=3346632 RepID=UPI0036C64716
MSSSTTARTARRRTLRIAVAALTAAAGLTLTACSGSGTVDAKPADSAGSGAGAVEAGDAGSAAGAQGSDAQADPGAKGGAKADTKGDSAGKQSGSAQAAGGGGAAPGVQRCHTSGLKASFATGEDAAPDPNAGGSTTTSVVLTNKGSRTCRIGGFPGVDLKAGDGGGVWSLQRSTAKHSSITLKPGDSTDFTINLVLSKGEGSWKPASAVITPPNETTSLTLDWPWDALVDQQGATHPGTFVNPIG